MITIIVSFVCGFAFATIGIALIFSHAIRDYKPDND